MGWPNMWPSQYILTNIKKYLSLKFDKKDLGEAHIILGIELERTLGCIYVS